MISPTLSSSQASPGEVATFTGALKPHDQQYQPVTDPASKVARMNSLLNNVETQLREESETQQAIWGEPSEVSEEAAHDRLVLPRLSPVDSSSRLQEMVVDPAQNVFLFVNPTSGGNAAARFMEAGLEHVRLTVGQPVNLWIWDIRQGNSSQKPGFIKLKRVVDGLNRQGRQPQESSILTSVIDEQTEGPPQPVAQWDNKSVVYVIVAGGDGTVMWCITELWAHGIDDERIAIGVVPYGTGNDFAKVFGWQKFNAVHPYKRKFKVLKELIKEWLNSKVVFHDIWEVIITVEPEGTFQKIDPKTRKKVTDDGGQKIDFVQSMSNKE